MWYTAPDSYGQEFRKKTRKRSVGRTFTMRVLVERSELSVHFFRRWMIYLISLSECDLAGEHFFVVGFDALAGPSDLVRHVLVLQVPEFFGNEVVEIAQGLRVATDFPGHKCAQYTVGGTRHQSLGNSSAAPTYEQETTSETGSSNDSLAQGHAKLRITSRDVANIHLVCKQFSNHQNKHLCTCIAGFVKGVRVRRGGQSASGSRRSIWIPGMGSPFLPRAPQGHSAFVWSRLLARLRLNTTALPSVH